MSPAVLLSKFAALPAHLQAEASDFIDFLLQKATHTPAAPSAPNAPEDMVSNPITQEFLEHNCEPLDPFISPGVPRLSLERGAGKHLITYIADDFDEPLEDFKDYM